MVLILLMVIIVLLCVYIKRIKIIDKHAAADGDIEYDNVIEKQQSSAKPIEMKADEACGTHEQDYNTILETPSTEAQYEEFL